jgi:hypothetical protein
MYGFWLTCWYFQTLFVLCCTIWPFLLIEIMDCRYSLIYCVSSTCPKRVWKYQQVNQNPYIKDEQTTQWLEFNSRTCILIHVKLFKSLVIKRLHNTNHVTVKSVTWLTCNVGLCPHQGKGRLCLCYAAIFFFNNISAINRLIRIRTSKTNRQHNDLNSIPAHVYWYM